MSDSHAYNLLKGSQSSSPLVSVQSPPLSTTFPTSIPYSAPGTQPYTPIYPQPNAPPMESVQGVCRYIQ